MSKARLAAAVATALAGILAGVYAKEGDFVDHRDDPGGPTRFGVTEKVARKDGYRGDMRHFPKHCTLAIKVCADAIYTRDYVERPGYMPLIEIEPAVAEELIDTAVNMGPPRPSRWFQSSLNELGGYRIKVDGKVGPATISAFRSYRSRWGSYGCVAMLDRLDAKQRGEYDRLVSVNGRLRTFHKGWVAHRIGNVDRRKCLRAP